MQVHAMPSGTTTFIAIHPLLLTQPIMLLNGSAIQLLGNILQLYGQPGAILYVTVIVAFWDQHP